MYLKLFPKKAFHIGLSLSCIFGYGHAAVIYTDIIPDQVAGGGFASYFLDLNNDSTMEFSIWQITAGNGVSMVSPSGAQVYGLTQANHDPYALGDSALIDGNLSQWHDNTGGHMIMAPGGTGDWNGVTDKYLGLRFKIGNDWHYGWARLDVVGGGTEFTIKDYAYEDIPNKEIYTPSTPQATPSADPAMITNVADVGDNKNGTDLEISFNKAVDETTVKEYRILVVRTAFAGSFDQAAAESTANYKAVTPNNNNVTLTLDATSKDVNNANVNNDISYTLFVLSMADTTKVVLNTLSDPSDTITLRTLVAADTSFNILAEDVSDNEDASDLQVTFNRAPDESGVGEYRIMFMKTFEANQFNLSQAEAVSSANYTSIDPTVNPSVDPIVTVLASDATDAGGNALVLGEAYKVFVMNVADGNQANLNSLSGPSNEVTLMTQSSAVSENIEESPFVYSVEKSIYINRADAHDAARITVSDYSGKVLLSQAGTTGYTRIDAREFPAGIYLVSIHSPVEFRTYKVVLH